MLALVVHCAVLGCSRANPPVPTAAASAGSPRASALLTPESSPAVGSVATLDAKPPAPMPSTAVPEAVRPPAAASASAPPPLAPPARADVGTKPQDCSAYDTSPDYRGLSAQDRAQGRLTCETRAEFRAFVASRRACKASSDCALISGSCPFDCYVPIAKTEEREVRAKLDSLAARLDKAGSRCVYSCIGPPEVECVNGSCGSGNR